MSRAFIRARDWKPLLWEALHFDILLENSFVFFLSERAVSVRFIYLFRFNRYGWSCGMSVDLLSEACLIDYNYEYGCAVMNGVTCFFAFTDSSTRDQLSHHSSNL